MPVATLERACLAFGHVPLLDHADLVIEPGERVALIGRNGGGKSSLLRIVAGYAQPDDGRVWREPGLAIGFVEQEPVLDPAETVFEAVAGGMGEAKRLVLEYHAAAAGLAGDGSEPALERLHALQAGLEAAGGWAFEVRAEAAVQRLGLAPDARVGSLSGGGRKRVALARAVAAEPGLLILDEPTNHLDLDGIRWLEEWLGQYKGTLLLVTHDRRFLDRVATRIVELDRGILASFPGNFAAYQRRKEQMLADEAVRWAKFDKVLAQEEVWIRKGIEARRTRNEGRVRRLEGLRRERGARRERVGRVAFGISEGDRSGEMVAELANVTKRFGERVIVRDFTTRIIRGDRIGLIGPNGAGKTTLIRLILGDLPPDEGKVRRGTKVEVAYFDQMREQLDPEATLAETISPGSEYVEVGGTRKHVIGYLGDFLFAPERARSPVKSLSGGERNRLLLARLFAKPSNVLVLDEPTNDLDIETLELLESLLQEYAGTVLLGSHDRAFLDNVVTQVIAFEGDGKLVEYAGGYEDWERVRGARPGPVAPAAQAEGARPARIREQKARLSYRESQELAELPARIERLEKEQQQLGAELADPDLYRDKAAGVATLKARHAEIEDELMASLERWESLEAKQKAAQS